MKRIGWLLLGMMAGVAGCTTARPLYTVAVAEERVVASCTYLETLSEHSDMGAFQIHPKLTYDARDNILRRAEMVGATHIVWLADQPFGAAALAYNCGQ